MIASYRIEKISDLMQIPLERLEFCLRDLQYAITVAHFAADGDKPPPEFDHLIWTDDSDHSVEMTAGGRTLMALRVTEDV